MAPVNGPIPFQTFVEQNGGSPELAKSFPENFFTSPRTLYFPKSQFRLETFSKNHQTGSISELFKIVLKDVYAFGAENPDLRVHLTEIFGPLEQNTYSQLRFYLFSRAAVFQFTKHGDCGLRSCYAGIKLVEMFKNTDLTICVQAAEKVDHVVVLLRNKNGATFVYDPLTNPKYIYPKEFHDLHILKTFTNMRKATAFRFDLDITKELADDYSQRWPNIQKLLLKLCDTHPDLGSPNQTVCVKKIKKVQKYKRTLKKEGVADSNTLPVIKKAVATFKNVVEDNRAKSK